MPTSAQYALNSFDIKLLPLSVTILGTDSSSLHLAGGGYGAALYADSLGTDVVAAPHG
jgi:hypothetical protein